MIQKKGKGKIVDKHAIKYNFGNTQWQGGDLEKLKAHLVDHMDLISHYPEREAETLVRLLSRRLEVGENEVMVTDGATGALHLIAGLTPSAVSLVLPPTNKEFYHALTRAKHTVRIQEDVKELSKLELDGVEMLWLSNPNNPDGRFFSRRSLLSLLREHPDLIVIVDLSLANFVVEDNIKASDIKKYPNLIVVSSFSKQYNIPGLRVGYMVANEERIKRFHQNYTPRCVGTLGIEACRYILLHPAQFTIPIRKWLRDSLDLADELNKLDGVTILYGAPPFFILQLEVGTADELSKFLLSKYSIKVGIASDDIDLKDNEIRICGFSNARANELIIEAISEYLIGKQDRD